MRSLLVLLAVILTHANFAAKAAARTTGANIAIEAMANLWPNQLPGDQLPLRQVAAIKPHHMNPSEMGTFQNWPVSEYSTHNQQESRKRLTKTIRCFRQEVHLELSANDWQGACKQRKV